MSNSFDPYHKWLGIPPEEQPPNHYRLLGIQSLEDDSEVINNAADRQMALLRTIKTGDRAELAQQLLNKVAAARISLLDPQRKAAYDQALLAPVSDAVEDIDEVDSMDSVDLDEPVPASSAKLPPLRAPNGRNGDISVDAPTIVADPSGSVVGRVRAHHKNEGRGKGSDRLPPWIFIAGASAAVVMISLLLYAVFGRPGGSGGRPIDEDGTRESGTLAIVDLPPQQTSEHCDFTSAVRLHNPEDWTDQVMFILGSDAPSGASIDRTSGTISWRPGEEDGGKRRSFTVRAMSGEMTAETVVRIEVAETNQPPVLQPIADREGYPGATLQIPLQVVDTDVPEQQLNFELVEGPPGAVVDPSTRALVWSVPEVKGPVDRCTIRVTDSAGATSQQTLALKIADREEFVDLLALGPAGVDSDVWQRKGDSLIGPLGESGDIEFHVSAPAEYELELVALRRHGLGELRLTLPVNDRMVDVVLDGCDATVSGLEPLDGRRILENDSCWRGSLFENDKRANVVCRVDGHAIRVTVDGRPVVRWKLDSSRLPVWPHSTRRPKLVVTGGVWHLEAVRMRRDLADVPADQPCENLIRYDVPSVAPVQFFQYLMDQGYYELALKFLDSSRNDFTHSYGSEFVQQIGFAKGLVPLLESQKTDEKQEARLRREAMHRWIRFADAEKQNPHACGATWRSALLLCQLAADESKQAKAEPEASEMFNRSAEQRLRLADKMLEIAREGLRGRLEQVGQGADVTNRDQLRQDWLCVKLAQASLAAHQAYRHADDEQLFREKMGDAANQFEAIYLKYNSWVAGWYARVQQARCLRLLGNPEDAEQSDTIVRDALAATLSQPQLNSLCDSSRGICEDADQFAASFVLPVKKQTSGPFDGRRGDAKSFLITKCGGSAKSEQAVADALQWLAKHQNSDGSWSFEHTQGDNCSGFSNPGDKKTRMGATGMVLLPLLAAGNTPRGGLHRQAVQGGLQYLVGNMTVQGSAGRLYEESGESNAHMYSHGIATAALAEAYGMTRDPTLKTAAQLAVNYIVAAQDPKSGGWLYEPRKGGDTSVTGWQLQALRAGTLSGLHVPPNVNAMASLWFDHVQSDIPFRATIGAVYGYRKSGDRTGSGKLGACTAIGLLARNYLGVPKTNQGLRRGLEQLAAKGMSAKDMYYNYYATQLIFHMDGPDGPLWRTWNGRMRDYLISVRSSSDADKGTWYFSDKRGGEGGGRIFHTAIAVLTLQVYYRFPPIHELAAGAEDDFPLD